MSPHSDSRRNQSLHVITLLLMAVSLLIIPGSITASPVRSMPPASEIIRQMIEVQRDLVEWNAKVNMRLQIGSLTVPVGTELFCRRPDQVALKFAGITLHPPGGFLLPDPVQFADSPQYRMNVSDIQMANNAVYYILDAEPLKPDQSYSWQFMVHGGTWLIARAYARSRTEESSLRMTYRKFGNRCAVPETVTGSGVLLLRDALPAGMGWAVDQAARQGVSYTVTFSDYQINTGIPAGIFGKK